MGLLGKVTAGAFLGGLAEDMKENREYARTKADKIQEYLYQRGLERRQEVNKTRNALQNSVEYLQSKDLDSRSINALLMQNPKEVIRLAAAAQQAEEDGRLTKAILNQAVEVASDFDDQGLTPSELIKKATPDFVEGADLKRPPEVETNMLQKLFGRKSAQEIMYDAYSQSVYGGEETGADVAASLSAPTIKGRAGGPSRVTTDIGVLAADEKYDSTYRRDAKDTIQTAYDNWVTTESQQLAKDLEDAGNNEELKADIIEQQKELTRIKGIDNPMLKYYELMKLHPSIALDYFSIPGYRVVLSDPDYFRDGTADLFTSDE